MARPSGFRRLCLSKAKWKKEFRQTHLPKGHYARLSPLEQWLLRRFCPKIDFVKIIK